MIFQAEGGEGAFMECCPARRPKLTDVHGRRRRNALWFHATTKGLYDPAQNRIRPYTAVELSTLWGVTPKAVRNGIKEAIKDQELAALHATA